jgi:cadmium resistance protein CadD (predicted permease)
MTFCSLLISFTFNIFILCYIGDVLAEQVRFHYILTVFHCILYERTLLQYHKIS